MSCALFRNYFKIQNAKNFEKYVSGAQGNTYITIGKNVDWEDYTPEDPTESANTFYNYWNNILGFKKITAADINLVIPRVDWVSGNTYIAYSQDLDIFKKTSQDQIHYDYQFYVRNTKDQVFKCLANNYTANTQTAVSTIMPEISIGGQLPENPYIEMGDGYKWKYLYTIPSGLKQKFFTEQFMPVTSEPIVTNTAVDGRLDVFKIQVKGAGYNNNVSATSIAVTSVVGDGAGADLTLQVTSTYPNPGGANVTEVNVISAGSGYTTAAIEITDPNRLIVSPAPEDAVIIPIIGPPGGHGSNVPAELGAGNLMISVDVEGDEDGELPLPLIGQHGFRQIGILLDPKLVSTGAIATGLIYRGTSKYTLTNSGQFQYQEFVYQGASLAESTFSGIVEHFDSSTYTVYVSNISGSISLTTELKGQTSGSTGFVTTTEDCALKRYSGNLLYIENTTEVLRSQDQINQFKFTLRF